MFLGIIGFLDFVHPVILRTQRFGNWVCFHPEVKGWETYILLGPLERANLNHWTSNVSINTFIYTPEIRHCQQEITGKCIAKRLGVNDWRLVMKDEIYLILALLVLMGIIEKPSLRIYFYIMS
jgi:hypothetical protein